MADYFFVNFWEQMQRDFMLNSPLAKIYEVFYSWLKRPALLS
jgi:hypothetical protein